MGNSPSSTVYYAVLQEGQLVLVRNAENRWSLPFFYEQKDMPWDLGPIIRSWEMFGWRVEPFRRVALGIEYPNVMVSISRFQADHKSSGAVSESMIRRDFPSALARDSGDFDVIVRAILDQGLLS